MCGTSSKNINEDDYDRSEFQRNVSVRGNKKEKKNVLISGYYDTISIIVDRCLRLLILNVKFCKQTIL